MKSRIFQDRLKRKQVFQSELCLKTTKSLLRNDKFPDPYRFKLINFLGSFPRNYSSTRLNNRCALTARSRAIYRDFRMSRLMFRKLALQGKLAGIKKSSF